MHRWDGAMQVAPDTCDPTTVYADLREEESLTAELRARAIGRARELGAKQVEFWRPPYGQGANRMQGFVELVCLDPAPDARCESGEPVSAPVMHRGTTSLAPESAEGEGDRHVSR
jgi:hypothetical protein